MPQDGKTPCMLAAENGFSSMLQTLLDYRAEVNGQDKVAEDALGQLNHLRCAPCIVVCPGVSKGTKMLGLSLSLAMLQDGNTPLILSAENGNTHVLDVLLGFGAEINMASKVHDYEQF